MKIYRPSAEIHKHIILFMPTKCVNSLFLYMITLDIIQFFIFIAMIYLIMSYASLQTEIHEIAGADKKGYHRN